VVFFFPSSTISEATAPLGILAVATQLLRNGYSVKLVNSTITPKFKRRMLEEVKDTLCLAISLVTGPMVCETAEIARAMRRNFARTHAAVGMQNADRFDSRNRFQTGR
jgi:hypothetical protein